MKRTYTISDLAGEFGVTTRTIRFYEEKGYLNPKREGTRRIYSTPDRTTLRLIMRGKRLGLTLDDFDILEFNEAFAAQALACTRQLGLADDDPRINTRGGAIALGHPLGMSGARLAITALSQLQQGGGKLALCTMCIGVGQGIAVVIEGLE